MSKVVKKRKRRLRPSIKYTLLIICLFFIFFIAYKLLNLIITDEFDAFPSQNEHAQRYSDDNCAIYYPKGFDAYKLVLNDVCNHESEEVQVFDYTLTKEGSYNLLKYSDDIKYILDENMKTPKIGEINDKAKMMISDYIRYTMKSKKLDYAYSIKFLNETYYEDIDELKYSCKVDRDCLSCYFDKYDTNAMIPLEYIGHEVGLDFTENKTYHKPIFVDPNRKAVALTFDDGPNDEGSTLKILNEFYKLDATATFYEIGYRLGDNTKDILSRGIAYGNEYGSHTMTHKSLTRLDAKEMTEEVYGVNDYFKNEFNYEIKTYRPPYGEVNKNVDEVIKMPAVMWTLDSNDWALKDSSKILNELDGKVKNHSIILFHDIYDFSADAAIALVNTLIRDGYQVVNISDLAKISGIELKQGSHYGWD